MNKYFVLLLALTLSVEGYSQKPTKSKGLRDVKSPGRLRDIPKKQLGDPVVVNKPSETSQKLKAAGPNYAATITQNDLERHLRIIASDEFEGRETGKKGQKLAADYISRHFAESGLVPPKGLKSESNPFFQVFELENRSWGDVYLVADGKKAVFLKDFYSLGAEIPNEEKLDVVFAGYGIEEGAYSDYKNLDVKGKAVVVLAGEPTDATGKSIVSGNQKPGAWATDWKAKMRLASRKGARAILFVSDGTQKDFAQTIERLHHWIEQPTMGFPDTERNKTNAMAFFLSPELSASVLKTTVKKLDKYKQQVKKAGKVTAPAFGKNLPAIALKAERKKEIFTTENVLGVVEGSDLKDEVVVITAHYDHVGIQDGKVYNGADDDGSGTVAILELAEAFAKAKAEGNGPRRTILFMPVTGEEKGLLGSEYYTKNPVYPLDQTIANLNIDMIGRVDEKNTDDKNYVYVIGSDRLSTQLHQISEDVNREYTQLKLDYTYNDPADPNQFYYRSDHYNFAKNNIPIIFYFNGVHEDYHQHTDEVEKIDFDILESRSKLIFYTAWELANRDKRPVVDKKEK